MRHYNCNYLHQCPYMYTMPWFNQFSYPMDMNLVQPNIYERTYPNYRSTMNLSRFSEPCSPTRPPSMSVEEMKRVAERCNNKRVCVWMEYEDVYTGTIYGYYDGSIKVSCDDGRNRELKYKDIYAIECKEGAVKSKVPHGWGQSPSGWGEGPSDWGEWPPDGGAGCPPSGGEGHTGHEDEYIFNDDYDMKEEQNLERYYCPYFEKFHNRQQEGQYEVIEESPNIPPGSYAEVDPDFAEKAIRRCMRRDRRNRIRVEYEEFTPRPRRETVTLRNVEAGATSLYGIDVFTGNDRVIAYKDIYKIQCLRRVSRNRAPYGYYYEECNCGE